MSFSKVFNSKMGLNAFSWLYDVLLGFGMIIVDEYLK